MLQTLGYTEHGPQECQQENPAMPTNVTIPRLVLVIASGAMVLAQKKAGRHTPAEQRQQPDQTNPLRPVMASNEIFW